MARKLTPVNKIDLSKLSNIRTKHVRIEEVSFDVENGNLSIAKLQLTVNVYDIPESSREYPRRSSHRTMRFSALTGELECDMPRSISFPLKGKTKLEFEALAEFSDLLRDILGLDKDFIPERELPPPDELAAKKKELEAANWELKLALGRIKELEELIVPFATSTDIEGE
jgi:hypothetical protein